MRCAWTKEVNKIEYESEIQLARRDRLQVLVTSVQRKLGEHRERLADDERQRVDKQLTIAERRCQLNRLNDSIRSISTARPPPEILEHYPTPLAQNRIWPRGTLSVAGRTISPCTDQRHHEQIGQ